MYNTINFRKLVKVEGDVFFYKKERSLYLHLQKCMFAGVTELKLTNGKSIYVIVHDKLFDEAPEYVQRFFIQHEIGHIKCGHLENGKRRGQTKINYIYRIFHSDFTEFEADWYAARKVGLDAVRAIKWVIEFCKKNNNKDALLEARIRYVYMIGKIIQTYIKSKTSK